jgi:hypothetical protein
MTKRLMRSYLTVRDNCLIRYGPLPYYTPHPTMTSAEQVSALLAQAQSLVSKSWEHGVFCETLIEIKSPEISVFAPKEVDPFPDGEIPKLGKDEVEKCAALKWASSDGVGMRQCVELGKAELVERRRGDGMQYLASSMLI